MDNIITTVDGAGAITGRGQITQTEKGLEAPESVIMHVQAARTYYTNFRINHVNRIKLYAAIEGLLGGNPPYDTAKLAAAGLSHIANVNTLDAKALYEKAALTFWNLVHQTENIVKFTLRPFQVQQDAEWSDWEEILARNWTKVIREKWTDFVPQMNTLTGQLVKFGVSPVIWPDEEDFRWETVDVSRFFIADNTPIITAKWDCICVDTTFTIQYLWSIYREYKDKTSETDWNIPALEQYLIYKANLVNKGQQNNQFYNPMDIQTALQNGNLNAATFLTDSVRLVSLLYKEYSGKISHFIFDPVGNSVGVDEFLFKVLEQYEGFHEGIHVFTYSPGEFYIHGNRGVGHKIFPVCQGLMQLDCNMLDMAKLSSTMVVKTAAGPGKDVMPIRVIPGSVVDVGQSEFVQNQLGANIGQLVTLAQYMEQKVNRNAVVSGDDPSVPDSDRGSKSAPEATMQAVKEFGVGKQNVAHFYGQWDGVIKQMTAKMLHSKQGYDCYEIVKEWKELCIEEGVPEEIFDLKEAKRGELPRHLSVRASRVAGDGSHLGLVMGLNGISGIAGGFSAKGQYNYRKDIITARLGMDYVPRYLVDSEVPDESGSGASVAFLENIAIKGGEMPQATKDNNHKTHIGTHLALITEIIQQVQAQKIDPVGADQVLSIGIPHTGEHIDFLAQDSLNQDFIKQLTPSWRQITKFAQLNRVKAQKMMQAEVRRRGEEEQQMNADQMEQDRKDKVAIREQNRKDFESQNKMDRAKEQSDNRARIMESDVEKKAENKRLEVELRAGNEREAIVRKPQEILADQSTQQLQSTLEGQVGKSPNPADFE